MLNASLYGQVYPIAHSGLFFFIDTVFSHTELFSMLSFNIKYNKTRRSSNYALTFGKKHKSRWCFWPDLGIDYGNAQDDISRFVCLFARRLIDLFSSIDASSCSSFILLICTKWRTITMTQNTSIVENEVLITRKRKKTPLSWTTILDDTTRKCHLDIRSNHDGCDNQHFVPLELRSWI